MYQETSINNNWLILDRCSVKVGPGNVTHGSGSKIGPQINEQIAGEPILVPFRANFKLGTK